MNVIFTPWALIFDLIGFLIIYFLGGVVCYAYDKMKKLVAKYLLKNRKQRE